MDETTNDVMAEWIRSALPGLIAEYRAGSRKLMGALRQETWPEFKKGLALFVREKATATLAAQTRLVGGKPVGLMSPA
jgi:hypothetical protein